MKKIMFNDKCGLTQAVLDGNKTMTRRIMKYDGKIYNKAWKYHDYYPSFKDALLKYSLYKIGEVVAVAQSYNNCLYDAHTEIKINGKDYLMCETKGWNNKMFVKANLMPHHIKITNVRIEQLYDISDEDCLREGIREFKTKWDEAYFATLPDRKEIDRKGTSRLAYASLIDKTSGRGTWKNNPWVYVYEFELID